MKFLVLALFCTFALVNGSPNTLATKLEEFRIAFQGHIQHCAQEIGVTKDVVLRMTIGDFSVNDQKTQCFVGCFFKRVGFMNEIGEPQEDVILTQMLSLGLKKDVVKPIVDKCVKIKGDDDCQTAYEIFKCSWPGQFAAKH